MNKLKELIRVIIDAIREARKPKGYGAMKKDLRRYRKEKSSK